MKNTTKILLSMFLSIIGSFTIFAEGPQNNNSGSSTAPLSQNHSISKKIANGHSYKKHVVELGEFPGISSRKEFKERIENFLDDSNTVSRNLLDGRKGYWNKNTGEVLIYNPNASDLGTFFIPEQGYKYFDEILD